ncbi:hypothetical protein RUMLAC_00906 [[Ruminococcus] lactaris ATCC 29176]|uniref:Uncharacterized protein n=1 Tax=[Ruminococcus] lactaris ATCC 29176 TaxID=471875 RepID=B5CN71_9FIRM|nr:hypothetical protein RUMLAC_00906 [[Ruminococcus] lactaris ATCC 29176]
MSSALKNTICGSGRSKYAVTGGTTKGISDLRPITDGGLSLF